MMRVAIVARYPASLLLPPEKVKPKFRAAGVEHPAPWLRSLCRALAAESSVQARVFMDSRAVCATEQGDLEGVPVIYTPRREPLRLSPYDVYLPAWIRMSRRIRDFDPHVVHAFGTQGQNGIVAVHQRRPSIVSLQGITSEIAPWTQFGWLHKTVEEQIEAHVVRRATALIAKTDFARRWALGLVPGKTIILIPNALNPEFLEVEPTFASKTILCIGSLHRWKGPDAVIRGFAAGVSDAEARLLMIGTGPELETCRVLARDLGVASRVQFVGQQDRPSILRHMQTARAVVLGSRMDTSPNAILEAHAAGLPVIATRTGGIPDMVRDGTDGLLVFPDDANEMGQGMARLLQDVDLGRRWGQLGRDRARREHDPARIAALHIEAYRTTRDLGINPQTNP